jgi:hypothetical protein
MLAVQNMQLRDDIIVARHDDIRITGIYGPSQTTQGVEAGQSKGVTDPGYIGQRMVRRTQDINATTVSQQGACQAR